MAVYMSISNTKNLCFQLLLSFSGSVTKELPSVNYIWVLVIYFFLVAQQKKLNLILLFNDRHKLGLQNQYFYNLDKRLANG